MGAVSKDFLHFGFGHGARVCPGKHLGELEIALVVGCNLQALRVQGESTRSIPRRPVYQQNRMDGTLVELRLRKARLARALGHLRAAAKQWVRVTENRTRLPV